MGLLDQLLGGGASGSQNTRGGMSPITMGLLALLAYRTYQGKGRLADMLGRGPGATAQTGGASPTGGTAQIGGGLGGLLGGLAGALGGAGAGGLLSGGLTDLLKQFQQAGQGDVANSWVGTGPNQPATPQQIEQALGAEKIDALAREAGVPRDEFLTGLSQGLPEAVDKLTPQGRVPTPDEAARIV